MKFKLAFALHNHQPVGNFTSVFEEAYAQCYLPFLKLARRHPGLRFSLHQSGILWDWIHQHHPEFFDLVREMVDSRQVELLTGAFYEPILPAIPDQDKVGQMQMLTAYLHEHFKVAPKGMWLAERVWEPHLPKTIHECGIRFLPLDDTHFKYTGLHDHQLFGTYITEEAGRCVTLLPIQQKLRYLIPFGAPDDIITFLRQAAKAHPGGLAVYADDGEKFGVWPETFRHCYTDRWLERFFAALEDNRDWLDVLPLGEAVEQSPPLGRIYLPSASYREMLHWALPADSFAELEAFEEKLKAQGLLESYGRFVRGGHWRGFLAKYPEANLMHKKMLAVSNLSRAVAAKGAADSHEMAQAQHLLYAGQCNCPYWHGVFGGLYLPHLRSAVYQKLIAAEAILRRLAGHEVAATVEDRDCDGYPDIILSSPDLGLVVSPQQGGRITELDSVGANVNLADVLTRRREGYHQRLLKLKPGNDSGHTQSIHDAVLTKEPGLEKLLVHDWYLRRPLVDHFLKAETGIDDFASGQGIELGDFVDQPYESSLKDNPDAYQVTLTRQGQVRAAESVCALQVQKIITFPKHGNRITIDYSLSQQQCDILPVSFAVEFDFNLLAPDAADRYALIDDLEPDQRHLAALAAATGARKVAYLDLYQDVGIELESSLPATLWRMPIYTVSLSEAGFEKVFQGNCTMFVYEMALNKGREFPLRFRLFAGPLDKMKAHTSAGQMRVSAI